MHLARGTPTTGAPPVTGEAIEPDTSRPITTGPGSSGTLPQAISAALCRAALIFCGISSPTFHVRGQELVRELPRTADLVRIGQPRRHVVRYLPVASGPMTPCACSVLRFIRRACGPIFRAIAAHTAGPLAVSASRSHRAEEVAEDQDLGLGRLRLAEGGQTATTSSGRSAS